jgi:hypothetical protein
MSHRGAAWVVLLAGHLQYNAIYRFLSPTYTSGKLCRHWCKREHSLCCRRVVTAGHLFVEVIAETPFWELNNESRGGLGGVVGPTFTK